MHDAHNLHGHFLYFRLKIENFDLVVLFKANEIQTTKYIFSNIYLTVLNVHVSYS